MTRNMSILAATVLAAVWFTGTGDAVAQVASPASRLDAVTVVAPRITYEKGYRPGSAVPKQIQVVKQSAVVDASDLDLTRSADMRTLETRIDEAAGRVCSELVDLYPLGEPEPEVCADRATADAMAQVRRLTRRVARN